MTKPIYRIPLMREIAALPKTGLTVVSTFSGCGGSCLGYRMAGYKVVWANEFIPEAQRTYRANHPETHLDDSDIRNVTVEQIRRVIGAVDVDIFDGSPPCASFSTAGKTSKGWGQVRKYSDTTQRTDDLFAQYIRILTDLKPKAFIAENVAGMVKGVSKGHFLRYLKMFEALPYRVEARLIDAQYLGVPQRRNRLIFQGVRKDVGKPVWPMPLAYRYSVRDAIPWIAERSFVHEDNHGDPGDRLRSADVEPRGAIRANPSATDRQHLLEPLVVHDTGRGEGPRDITNEPCPTITVGSDHIDGGGARQHFKVLVQDGSFPAKFESAEGPSPTIVASRSTEYRYVEPESALANAVGGEWDKLKPGEQSQKYMSLILPTEDAPCPTVTALGGTSAASVAHPYERRKFTIEELRRICGFPDDFVLTGTYAQQWERLGRAVAPPVMAAIAGALRDKVFLKGSGI